MRGRRKKKKKKVLENGFGIKKVVVKGVVRNQTRTLYNPLLQKKADQIPKLRESAKKSSRSGNP